MPGIRVAAVPIRAHRAQDRCESSRLADTTTSTHLPGLILWLPRRDPSHESIPGLDEGAYNHPVVVLSVFAQDGKVVVLPLTSFDETDLLERHRESPYKRKSYLPIDPANAHPDNGKLLRLKNPLLPLRKKSYINTKSKHSISLEILRPYQCNADFVLSKASYQELIEYCGFQPPPPPPPPSPLPKCIPPAFERTPAPYAQGHHQSAVGHWVTRPSILDAESHRWTDPYPTLLDHNRSRYTTHYGTVPVNHYPGRGLATSPRTAQTYNVPDYRASSVHRPTWQSDAYTRSNMTSQDYQDTINPGCTIDIGVVILVMVILLILYILAT
ncbi:hypothetical protein PG995_002793 [Apiospora arundinis]